MHMHNYPQRNWGLILQQDWSMCLKEKTNYNNNRGNNHNHHPRSKKEICQHFNRGLCTAGKNCKYDHRCLECGKFGHGAHICSNKKGQSVPSSTPASSSSQVVVLTNQPTSLR